MGLALKDNHYAVAIPFTATNMAVYRPLSGGPRLYWKTGEKVVSWEQLPSFKTWDIVGRYEDMTPREQERVTYEDERTLIVLMIQKALSEISLLILKHSDENNNPDMLWS